MESYTHVPNDIQTTFQGISGCLGLLADHFNGNTLCAEDDGWDMDESDCLHLCLDIKSVCVTLEKIQLCLSEIAKNYNKSFITEYPLYFQSYIDEYQKMMQGDDLRTLTDVLKLDTHQPEAGLTETMQHELLPRPEIQQLIQLVKEMNLLMDSILKLCRKVIATEERIRQTPKKCWEMMEQVCLQAQKDQQGVISIYLQANLNPKTIPTPEGKPMISDLMEQYASPEDFASAYYHRFTLSDINTYVVQKALMDSRLKGLTKEEQEWWGDNHEMIKDIRYVIEHFDELDVNDHLKSKQNKHFIAAQLSMLIKWAHLQNATTNVSIPQFLKYFKGIYKGQLPIPASATYHKYKNTYSKDDWLKFTDKIETMLNNRKQKAIQVSLLEKT